MVKKSIEWDHNQKRTKQKQHTTKDKAQWTKSQESILGFKKANFTIMKGHWIVLWSIYCTTSQAIELYDLWDPNREVVMN